MSQYNAQCPACKSISPLSADLVDQAVVCSTCGHQFVVQPPSDETSLSPEYVRSIQGEPFKSKQRQRSEGNYSSVLMMIVSFFDPRLSRYLAPAILRITWLYALICLALFMLLVGTGRVYLLAPDFGQQVELSSLSNFDVLAEHMVGVLKYSGVAISFLWLRVILELCLVLFDISKTLKESKEA